MDDRSDMTSKKRKEMINTYETYFQHNFHVKRTN